MTQYIGHKEDAAVTDPTADASAISALKGLLTRAASQVSALGTTTDAPASPSAAEDATARTGISLWKGIKNILILLNAKFAALGQAAMAASMPVAIANNQSAVPVSGTFYPGTQPVSIATMPSTPVTGTFWQTTQPVSVAAYTTPTHTAVNVTTTTGAVLAANANRLYALLVNDSDTVIYIKLGAAAVANQGIRLNADGGSYEMSAMLGNLYTGAINGIHAGTGNKVLLMTEGV